MTEIVGGPDIYVDRLSTLQLTCRCRSGWWWGEAGFRRAGDEDDDDNDDESDDDDVKVYLPPTVSGIVQTTSPSLT